MNFYIRNLDIILIPSLVLFNQGYLFALFACVFYIGIKIVFISSYNKPYLFFIKTKEGDKIYKKIFEISLLLIKDQKGANHYINIPMDEHINKLVFDLLCCNNHDIQTNIINEIKNFNEDPIFYDFLKNCVVIDLKKKEIDEFYLALMFLKLSMGSKIKVIFNSKNIKSFFVAIKTYILNENFRFNGLGYKHKYYGYSSNIKILKKSIVDFWVMLEDKNFKCFYETNNVLGEKISLATSLTKSLLCSNDRHNINSDEIIKESNNVIKSVNELPKIRQKEHLFQTFNKSKIKQSKKIL